MITGVVIVLAVVADVHRGSWAARLLAAIRRSDSGCHGSEQDGGMPDRSAGALHSRRSG